jgi:hypothetical protein
MTRDEVKIRLQRHFENNTYYAQTDFNASIQDGYDEVAAITGVVMKATTLPFTPGLTYYDMLTLIPDFIGVVAIFNAVTKRWLAPTSINKFNQDRPDWECAGGTPFFFAPISHRYIAIYKKPLSTYGDMYVFYRAAAPTLAGGDSILIPDDYIDAIEDYVKTDLWEQQQEWTKGTVHFDTYLEMANELFQWVHSKRNPNYTPVLRDNIS